MVSALQALADLEGVLLLHVGEVINCSGEPGGWTHVLHGRYPSKAALDAYSLSQMHVDAVTTHIKPNLADNMALDWESEAGKLLSDTKIVRTSFVKWKEGVGKEEITKAVSALWSQIGMSARSTITQFTCGDNFSPARAKGFQFGMLWLDSGSSPTRPPALMEAMAGTIAPLAQEVTMVDFLPGEQTQTASKF
eukprot:TRINITY_DN4733_c0_g1_i2.p1 TRINITY_DN4733_c0_g1~~TRINITY_DN4733_c0_g1_i2.p1  ORF type:complete len:193 (+),score=43.61 TRINITY_DN4733_c0_g1_i2:128-706(+)